MTQSITPNPMRVSMMNSTLADKLNQKRGVFTEEEQKSHIKEIIRRIEGGKKVTEAVTVKSKKVKDDKGFYELSVSSSFNWRVVR